MLARAAALLLWAASARANLRQLNRTSHDEDHETYASQRARVAAAVGDYKFYIYAGGAFDAITTALLDGDGRARGYHLAEESAELWTHRALLADPRRTEDPSKAEVFFVPAYLTLSKIRGDVQQHGARVTAMLRDLARSRWFRRRAGADHVFGYSSTNPGVARSVGFPALQKVMNRSFFGTFEMNPAWVGGGPPPPRERAKGGTILDRMVPMPYVVNAEQFGRKGESLQDAHHHEISVFFAANRRPNAVKWSGCDRSKAMGLAKV